MSNSLLPEDLAWLRQCAAVDGNTYDRLLLHLLERVEALEAAQQQPHQDKLDRLIALDRGDDEPTPEAAPVATDEKLLAMRSWSSYGPTIESDLVPFGRNCYNLGRQHGAAQPPRPPARRRPAPPAPHAAPPAAPAALAQPEGEGPSERIISIAKAVQENAFGWEPDARLIGNVCAEDVADLCGAILARWGRPTALPAPEVGEVAS